MTNSVNQVHITHISLWLSSSICCVSETARVKLLRTMYQCQMQKRSEVRDLQVQRAFCKAKSKAKPRKLIDWQLMIVPPQQWHAEILAKYLLLFIGLCLFFLSPLVSLSVSLIHSLSFFSCVRASKCQFPCDGMWQGLLPGGTAGNRGPHKLILILFQIIQSV